MIVSVLKSYIVLSFQLVAPARETTSLKHNPHDPDQHDQEKDRPPLQHLLPLDGMPSRVAADETGADEQRGAEAGEECGPVHQTSHKITATIAMRIAAENTA